MSDEDFEDYSTERRNDRADLESRNDVFLGPLMKAHKKRAPQAPKPRTVAEFVAAHQPEPR